MQAVFFDFDGVLAETLEIKKRAFIELFSGEQEHLEAVVRLHEDNLGMNRRDKFRAIYADILGMELTDARLVELEQEFASIVVEQVVAADAVPGSIEALESLAPDTKLFVVSGTPHDELVGILRRRGIETYFDDVRGAPTPKVDAIRELCALHSIDVRGSVMVGDATTDRDAAIAAGARFIHRQVCGAPPVEPATARIDDLTELVSLLHGLRDEIGRT